MTTTARAASPRRLSAEQRRRQLVGIGLQLLTERPIHDVALDEVADAAGISRGLLFHYFPNKRAYYAAVVEAAAGRLLRAATPDADVPADARLTAIVSGFVSFIERRREPYLALVRGTAGGDPLIVEVFDRMRGQLADLVLEAAGVPDDDRHRSVARAWLAFAEELALAWTTDPRSTGPPLVELLVTSLTALVDLADRTAEG